MNLESVGQGDHLCMYYDSTEQRSAVVAEYVRLGLEKNERCLCVADEQALPGIVLALSRAGVEVPHERRRGRLLLLSPRDAHLQGGRFDAEGMMTLLDDAVEQAVDDGFNGLRAVGDMSWILDGVPGTDRVFEYEAMMNAFYPTSRALGLCLYDRRGFETSILERALHTHPVIATAAGVFGNSHFDPAHQLRPLTLDAAGFETALAATYRGDGGANRVPRRRDA